MVAQQCFWRCSWIVPTHILLMSVAVQFATYQPKSTAVTFSQCGMSGRTQRIVKSKDPSLNSKFKYSHFCFSHSYEPSIVYLYNTHHLSPKGRYTGGYAGQTL
jgi:hypothetical protein